MEAKNHAARREVFRPDNSPRLSAILIGLLSFPFVNSASAGSNENAKIALHLQAVPTGKTLPPCQRLTPLPPCNPDSSFRVQGELNTGYDLYILAVDGDTTAGIAGASFVRYFRPSLRCCPCRT